MFVCMNIFFPVYIYGGWQAVYLAVLVSRTQKRKYNSHIYIIMYASSPNAILNIQKEKSQMCAGGVGGEIFQK